MTSTEIQAKVGSQKESYFRYPEYDLDALAARFGSASPFPHLVLPDFLKVPVDVIEKSYPPPDWKQWSQFDDNYQVKKMWCDDLDVMPPLIGDLIRELNSPRFLRALEKIIGIESIIPDPYLLGGGMHCSGTGGVLIPHTDFHYYERLNLFRRANLLLYLNPQWRREDGGALGLYKKGTSTPEVQVVPTFGTCVIFKTDDQSVHGFTDPIAPGRYRRSIALYYYTSKEAETYSGDTSTHWQVDRDSNRVRSATYHSLMFVSKKLSALAFRFMPKALKE